MTNKNNKIGILDSGIGGTTTLNEIKKLLPLYIAYFKNFSISIPAAMS